MKALRLGLRYLPKPVRQRIGHGWAWLLAWRRTLAWRWRVWRVPGPVEFRCRLERCDRRAVLESWAEWDGVRRKFRSQGLTVCDADDLFILGCDDHGLVATWHVEYGETLRYGTLTPCRHRPSCGKRVLWRYGARVA